MKYSCYGCKHKPYKREYPCTTCGKYVLSEDGESTVFIYNNWALEENVFMKDSEESSQNKQERLHCNVSMGLTDWNCYKDCAFWNGKRCTNYEYIVNYKEEFV